MALGCENKVLALGAVGCASVHRKASLLEWIRTAHPECHVLFIPGGYTAELQPADIAIQQPLEHSNKQQAKHFFAESVCLDNALLDLRLITTKRLMGSACLRRGGKTRASQRKLGATSTSTSHSSMRRRWNMKSWLRVRQASTNAMHCFSGTVQDRRCAYIVPMM